MKSPTKMPQQLPDDVSESDLSEFADAVLANNDELSYMTSWRYRYGVWPDFLIWMFLHPEVARAFANIAERVASRRQAVDSVLVD